MAYTSDRTKKPSTGLLSGARQKVKELEQQTVEQQAQVQKQKADLLKPEPKPKGLIGSTVEKLGQDLYQANKYAAIQNRKMDDIEKNKNAIASEMKQKYGLNIDDVGYKNVPESTKYINESKYKKYTPKEKEDIINLRLRYQSLSEAKQPFKEGFIDATSLGQAEKYKDKYVYEPRGIDTSELDIARSSKTAKLGSITGELAKNAAYYNILGPIVGKAVGPAVGKTLGTGALGQFGTELAKDIVIGGGTGVVESLSRGTDVKTDLASNVATDIVFNVLLGVGGKLAGFGIDALKKAKTVDKVEEVAKQLDVTPQQANKIIDDTIAKESAKSTDIQTQIKPEYQTSQSPLKAVREQLNTRSMAENTGIDSGVSTSAQLKERGFSENIRTDANRVDEIRKSFDNDPEFYSVLSNKDTLQSAQERFSKGFDNALEDFERTKNQLRADNVPLAKLLADDAASRGDMQTARRIIVDVAETLTTAGQFSQAAKILRESNDPVTVLRFVQKEIDRLNDVGGKRYGKKWNKIDLTDEELNLVNGIGKNATDEQKEQLFNQLFESVSKRIPTTRREQFDAWRRIAMLFNPKTHVRNIAGNTLMYGIKKLSNEVATVGEKLILPKDQLTKGRVTKELKQVANNVFEQNKKSLLEGSRWEVFGVKSPFADKPIFKSGWLNTLDDISKRTLEAEDVMFFKKNFTDDLAGFMNARGLKEPTKEAVDYATRRAQEATFRQANKLAEAINKMKGSRYGLLVDAAIPFTKTPANILSTGIDYSPIGAIKGAISLVNNADPKLAIETLSKGLTGSALSLVGYYMAMNGLARGDYEKDKEVEGLYQATGQLPNSIKMGNGSYTIDWAQPLSIPFFMGVAFAESMKKDSDNKAQAVFDALTAGGETLINQSMLQGVSDLFGGYGKTTEKIAQLPINYMTQGFPTVFGQIARTIDPTKRQSDYSTLLSGTLTGLQSKTPIASQFLPEKRGILGETQKFGKGLLNAFQQFISPGYIGTPSDNPLVQEIDRLYKVVGSDFLPKYNVTSFQSLGEQYKLTGQERSELQRIMGEYTNQQLTKIINTTTYKNATDEQKAEMIKDANETGYKLAKQAIVEERSKK